MAGIDNNCDTVGASGPTRDIILQFGNVLDSLRDAASPSEEFAIDYLIGELLSKYDNGESSDLKALRAVMKFNECDNQCFDVNRTWSHIRQKRIVGDSFSFTMDAVLFTAANKIRTLLGEFDGDLAIRLSGHGPGATESLPRRKSHLASKLTTPTGISPGMRFIVEECSAVDSCYFTNMNRITTVPKSYKIDRVIAIEPSGNLFYQKGIGAIIRRRLLGWGIDLNDQRKNQEMARIGAKFDSFATIDLSSASDSISRRLVEDLMPPDWLSALERCRSRCGLLGDGDVVFYAKWSSMGNGYTFELESLLFAALLKAVIELCSPNIRSAPKGDLGRYAVYGDDIICHKDFAVPLIEVLGAVGFKTNASKTFIEGEFRESCGKHYYKSQDVSPFYVRRPIQNLDELMLFHNNVARWTSRVFDYIPKTVYDFLVTLRNLAPKRFRGLIVPDGVGECGFIGNFDELCPRLASSVSKRWRGWEGFAFRGLINQAVRQEYDTSYLCPLYRSARRGGRPSEVNFLKEVPPESDDRRVVKEKQHIGWMITTEWVGLGLIA